MLRIPPTELKYAYSPADTPVAVVEPGETFVIETSDCFTGRFRNPTDFTPENAEWVDRFLNPVTGPVYVEGATAGGAIEVTIHDIELISPAIVVVSRCRAPSPADWWLEEDHVTALEVVDGWIELGPGRRVPARPLIGCLATAPARETILSRREADEYGGNTDCGAITTGATVTLPVNADGALLYFGDVKAAIGNGEVVCAPEIGSRITVSARPVPRPPELRVPRIRTATTLTTVASDISLAEACRRAFADLKAWLQAEWPLTPNQAAVLTGIAAHCGVAQVSNQLHTGTASIELTYLPSR